MIPGAIYYARLTDVTKGKTPKYQITEQAGYYEPMEALKGKDGAISFFLLVSHDSGSKKDNAPAYRLQGKNSLNVIGLKEYFVDGRATGFAWGYPLDKETFSKERKPNPFYDVRNDLFLFIVHNSNETSAGQPIGIEMLVFDSAKALGAGYVKQLALGGFDDVLDQCRNIAKNQNVL